MKCAFHYRNGRRRLIFFGFMAALWLIAAPATALADDFGSPTAGQHVYDRAGVLTQTQLQTLENEVEAVGAPTMVYIQVKQASQQQARQDARALMDAWDVESAAGAGDGFVMLFDLNPGDTQHGQLGLYAGATWASQLPSEELDRISTDVMGPLLTRGDLAGGISAGLDATASSMQNGPQAALGPPPDGVEPAPSGAAGPFDWFWVFFFGIFAFSILRTIARAVGGRDADGRYRGVRIGNTGWYFGGGGTGLSSGSSSSSDSGFSGSSGGGASDGGSSGGTSF